MTTNPQAVQSMVERVAQALWMVSDNPLDGEESWPWAECADAQKDGYRLHARAAIEAMKTPSEEMMLAGQRANLTLKQRYSAMISAALADSVMG